MSKSLFGLEEDDETEDTGTEETEETEEEEDDLADVEPELRARIEKFTQVRVGHAEQKVTAIREKARERGVAITDDGDLALLDAQRLAGWVPQQAAAEAPRPAPAAAAEEDEEIPDPSLDAAGFQKWFAKQQKAAIEQATKPILDQLRSTAYAVAESKAEVATRRAAEVVESYGLGEIARHPAFAAVFQKTLMETAGSANWDDEETLGRLALMILPDLKKLPAKAAKSFPQQGADGRWVKSKDLGRSAVSRGLMEQAGATNGTRARPNSTAYDDIDRITAERLGISLEEARGLKDPSGDAYVAARAKRRK